MSTIPRPAAQTLTAATAEEGLALHLLQLAEASALADEAGEAALLAEAAALIALLVPTARVDTLPVLLPVRAHASAALALVPPEAGYMLSRGGHGSHMASVVLPGMDEEVSAEGASVALALLGALAAALHAALQSGALSPYLGGKLRAN